MSRERPLPLKLSPVPAGRVRSGALSDGLPSGRQDEEFFEALAERPGLRIERIVSTGQTTPDGQWYDQIRDEFVLLVSGAARLRVDGEDEDRALGAGDWLVLPAHCRHRVTWTQAEPPTIWLSVHYDAAPDGLHDEDVSRDEE